MKILINLIFIRTPGTMWLTVDNFSDNCHTYTLSKHNICHHQISQSSRSCKKKFKNNPHLNLLVFASRNIATHNIGLQQVSGPLDRKRNYLLTISHLKLDISMVFLVVSHMTSPNGHLPDKRQIHGATLHVVKLSKFQV